jgi:hypothetical protein
MDSLPTVGTNEQTEVSPIEEKPKEEKKKPTTRKPRKKKGTVTIEVPLSENATGYATTRIDVQGLSGACARAFKRLTRGLEDSNSKLKDGSPVNNNTKAIKWLLEQLDQ